MAPNTDDRHLAWKETSRELVLRCPVFSLFRSRRYPAADAEEHSSSFYVLDARDWVTVVPVLSRPSRRDEFVMVRQYRHGIDRVTLEFPAGLVEPGEPPERAAIRELTEETGCEPRQVRHLGTIGAAPAFMDNWCHVYAATVAEGRHEQALDESERVEVVTMPVDEVVEAMGTGEMVNSVTVMSLYYYLRSISVSREGADRNRTGV